MSELTVSLILGLIGALTGVLSLIFQRRKTLADAKKSESEARKTDADTASVISEASGELIDRYRERMAKMEAEADEFERRFAKLEAEIEEVKALNRSRQEYIEHLLRGIQKLVAQIKSHDSCPDWEPTPWEDFIKQ